MVRLTAVLLAVLSGAGLASGALDSARPFLTFADRSVSYLTLQGLDHVVDAQSPQPEHILLRVFVASRLTNSSSILVKGAISRESLDREPRWDVEGNRDSYFVCLLHQWRPRLFLR